MGILDFFKKIFETKPGSNTGNGSNNHSQQEPSALIFKEAENVYTLKTPKGLSFLLDDAQGSISLEDHHGNSIIMDKNGITIKSIADINLQAERNVRINATQDLEQQSGANISLKANLEFNAEGTARAKLSSSGNTEIKGSLIQIN